MTASRFIWAFILLLGLIGLAVGMAFWRSRPEMVILTLIFGGCGLYLTLQALPRLLKRKKNR